MIEKKKKYRIDCYARLPREEGGKVYDFREDAEMEAVNLEEMSPENLYFLRVCDEEGNDLED